MAYTTVPLFHHIPAIYDFMPAKQHRRRTATNILAGYFDPVPLRLIDSDNFTIARLSSTPDEEIGEVISTEEKRGSKKRKVAQSEVREDAGPAAAESEAADEMRALDDEQRNETSAVSGSGTVDTLSSCRSSPPLPAPQLTIVSEKEKTKNSGLSNVESSKSSSIRTSPKRKRSEDSNPEQPLAGGPILKKNKIRPAQAKSITPVSMSGTFGTSSPGPLSAGPSCGPSSPSSLLTPSISSHISQDNSQKPAKTERVKYYEVDKHHGAKCLLCDKISTRVDYIKQHLRTVHGDVIGDTEVVSPPESKKIRGSRKNVALKKGWKGWVEEDLEPQRLIQLDKPEILPERTTRSGRKI